MPHATPYTVVTVVHGDYHECVAGWVSHLRATGCQAQIHLVVLDNKPPLMVDRGVTVEHVHLRDPAWGSGDYVRLKRIHELCASGRTCLQIDLDTCFNVDPTVFAGVPAPFLISRGLGFPAAAVQTWGFSLCTGFYIAKPQALPLLNEWIALEHSRRSLDQEDLNFMLLRRGMRWLHTRSSLVEDAFVVSDDGLIGVLPDRAVTRDPEISSFGAVHNRQMLERHRRQQLVEPSQP